MLVKYCFSCRFHKITTEAEGYSFCARENCHSQFSKCLSKQALARFLDQESLNAAEMARCPEFTPARANGKN